MRCHAFSHADDFVFADGFDELVELVGVLGQCSGCDDVDSGSMECFLNVLCARLIIWSSIGNVR